MQDTTPSDHLRFPEQFLFTSQHRFRATWTALFITRPRSDESKSRIAWEIKQINFLWGLHQRKYGVGYLGH